MTLPESLLLLLVYHLATNLPLTFFPTPKAFLLTTLTLYILNSSQLSFILFSYFLLFSYYYYLTRVEMMPSFLVSSESLPDIRTRRKRKLWLKQKKSSSSPFYKKGRLPTPLYFHLQALIKRYCAKCLLCYKKGTGQP